MAGLLDAGDAGTPCACAAGAASGANAVAAPAAARSSARRSRSVSDTALSFPTGSLNENPCRPQQRERDQPDYRRDADQEGIADLEAEQHAEADKPDRRRQPVADGNLAEQDGCAEDRSDRGGIGAFDKA